MIIKTLRWGILAAVLLLAAATAVAETLVEPVEDGGAVEYVSYDDYGNETDRWWGAAGTVLCGAELWLVRYQPTIGFHPAALAVGIGGCALAALDIMTTK